MTKPHLVTDRQAEKMEELGGSAWVVDLLATREALMADDERLLSLVAVALRYIGAGEHDCTGPEDCWTCAADEALASPPLTQLHGDSTSGTSAPPKTEKP